MSQLTFFPRFPHARLLTVAGRLTAASLLVVGAWGCSSSGSVAPAAGDDAGSVGTDTVADASPTDVPAPDVAPADAPQADVPPADTPQTDASDTAAPVVPRKLDILWVIDNSSSMCQEQGGVVAAFGKFIGNLIAKGPVDYRVAVVTTDVLSDGHKGTFRHNVIADNAVPFACSQAVAHACQPATPGGDAACSNTDGRGPNWACYGPDKTNEQTNCNGSLNTGCQKRCTTDADCDQEFAGAAAGDACTKDPAACAYRCLNPGGGVESGCVARAHTSGCPAAADVLKQMTADTAADPKTCGGTGNSAAPYLTSNNAADLFRCIASVGAEQSSNANLESGLLASIQALSLTPFNGTDNTAQARCFLRDDAHLLVVYVSDEEDCSTAPGAKLPKEQYGTCTCLPDSDTSWDDPATPETTLVAGPLMSVADTVKRLKALKANPSQVLVAAIVGDHTQDGLDPDTSGAFTRQSCFALNAIAADPTASAQFKKQPLDARDQARVAYCGSKCGVCADTTQKHAKLANTSVCGTANGRADFGSRYVQLVHQFGPNGVARSVCATSGLEDTVAALGTWAAGRMSP